MNKPLVYNYKTAEDKIAELTARVEELDRENDYLRIRCRIAEADRLPVLYLCDGGACGHDCNANGCRHTSNIEYAKNFHKVGDEHYYEVEPVRTEDYLEFAKHIDDEIATDVKTVEADVKVLLGLVKGD